MEKEILDRLKKDYDKGNIIICPQCNRIDIDPYTHFRDCNPVEERQRQEAMDYLYDHD